jgi:hypothetical protein
MIQYLIILIFERISIMGNELLSCVLSLGREGTRLLTSVKGFSSSYSVGTVGCARSYPFAHVSRFFIDNPSHILLYSSQRVPYIQVVGQTPRS